MDKIIIKNQDCFDFLKSVEDKSVNLVLIDPPYNINKCSKWDKWDTVDNYIEFMNNIFKECERVLKTNGTLYFWHNDFEQCSKIQNVISKNTKLQFKQIIFWNKPRFRKMIWSNVSEKNTLRAWFNIHEYCFMYIFEDKYDKNMDKFKSDENNFTSIKNYLRDELKKSGLKAKDIAKICNFTVKAWDHYVRDVQWNFIPENQYTLIQNNTNFFKKDYNLIKQEYDNYLIEYKDKIDEIKRDRNVFNKKYGDNDLSNFWQSKITNNGKLHPTQKPIDLIEKIILASSNENDVVLDCFLGSGTTAVACIKNNRKIWGCELDENYYEIIQKRINEIK